MLTLTCLMSMEWQQREVISSSTTGTSKPQGPAYTAGMVCSEWALGWFCWPPALWAPLFSVSNHACYAHSLGRTTEFLDNKLYSCFPLLSLNLYSDHFNESLGITTQSYIRKQPLGLFFEKDRQSHALLVGFIVYLAKGSPIFFISKFSGGASRHFSH